MPRQILDRSGEKSTGIRCGWEGASHVLFRQSIHQDDRLHFRKPRIIVRPHESYPGGVDTDPFNGPVPARSGSGL